MSEVQEPTIIAMARAGYEAMCKRYPDHDFEPWEETLPALKADWTAAARAMWDARLEHLKGRTPPYAP